MMDHFVDMVLDLSIKCAVNKNDVVLCTRVANACACERAHKEGRMVELEPVP